MKLRYIQLTFSLFLLCISTVNGLSQKLERDYIRKGNRQLADSTTIGAEISYRSALEVNKSSNMAKYNIARALMAQDKGDEAMNYLKEVVDSETDRSVLAKAYHNIGLINHAKKDYGKAVEAYINSLKNNPKDDETRYNLAVAKRFLMQNQQNKQNQENKDKQDPKQDKKQDKKEDKKQDEKKQNQDQEKQQEQQKNNMSKQNAEQLLQYILQKEKDTKDKMKEVKGSRKRKSEKDW